MKLFELKKQRAHALAKLDSIIAEGERNGGKLTEAQGMESETLQAALRALTPEIQKLERNNSIRQHLVEGKLVPAAGNLRQAREPHGPVMLSEDYYNRLRSALSQDGGVSVASFFACATKSEAAPPFAAFEGWGLGSRR